MAATPSYRSTIDLTLGQVPEVQDSTLYNSLQELYDAVQILANEVQPLVYASADITDAAYTLLSTDQLLRADSASNNVVITLPLAVTCTGKRYTIKRIDASANTVSFIPTSPELVDGVGTAKTVLTLESYTLQAGPDYWDIV